MVVSESGGTRLTARDGRWVVASHHGVVDSEASLVPLLPLLEHKPLDAIRRVQSLGGPPFPWQALVVFALSGESAYWQEQAVPGSTPWAPNPRGNSPTPRDMQSSMAEPPSVIDSSSTGG